MEELNKKKKITYPVCQSVWNEWAHPRERKKKHGCPNTSIWNKTWSRAKRICKSGTCKFFLKLIYRPSIKTPHARERVVRKLQMSEDVSFVGRAELSEDIIFIYNHWNQFQPFREQNKPLLSIHSWWERRWIRTFPKGNSTKWNTNHFIQHLSRQFVNGNKGSKSNYPGTSNEILCMNSFWFCCLSRLLLAVKGRMIQMATIALDELRYNFKWWHWY